MKKTLGFVKLKAGYYMYELIPSFKDSLFSPTYEIVAEYAEIGIDALLDSDVLKGIPVVGTLSAICKVGYNIHERNLLKQTLRFIIEFNSGTLSQEKIDEYRYELENNYKKAEKELGRVLILLGNHIEQMQSQVLGSFFKSYVNGAISWGKFCELTEANRRIFVSDYQILIEAAKQGGINLKGRELYQIDRLISLGLLQYKNRLGGVETIELGKPYIRTYDVIITTFGKTFCQHLPIILIDF